MTRRALTAEIMHPSALGAPEQALWARWRGADRALGSPFLSFEYVRAVGAVHPGVRLAVFARGEEPQAFLPFQQRGRTARAFAFAEPAGGAMTDAVGVIADPGCEIAPQELLQATRLSSFFFTHLVTGQARCGLRAEQIDRGLAIDLSATPDYWKDLKRSRRAVLEEVKRRRRRAAEELGPLHFHWHAPASGQMLDRLIVLKTAQYRRTGAAEVLRPAWTRELLRGLLALNAPECSGVLSTLEAGGRLIAAHFGLRSGPVLHYWFPVYDPEFSRFSPGRLLLAALIDGACAQGISRIERGLGTAPAKRDFANAEVAYGRGLLLQPGVRAAAVRLALAARWRWQRLIQPPPPRPGPVPTTASSQAESGAEPAKSIPLGP